MTDIPHLIQYADLDDLILGLTRRAGKVQIRKMAGGEIKISFRVKPPAEPRPASTGMRRREPDPVTHNWGARFGLRNDPDPGDAG